MRFVAFLALFAATAVGAQRADVEREIAAIEVRLERALVQRDRAALEPIIASRFTWLHASDGRIETREAWLASAAAGAALAGVRQIRTEHTPAIDVHGSPPHTVVRVARVRIIDSSGARESWLRQSHVFVREDDGAWRVAMGQGTVMYEGPPLDMGMHQRYIGIFDLPDGRVFKTTWEDGFLFGTLPNGAKFQLFLGSPTEEAVRTTGSGRMRFTLGPDGRPVTAALVRGTQELWRATRRP
jgi:ketosteroid isomerase-like protein